jgi:hypothetical protein
MVQFLLMEVMVVTEVTEVTVSLEVLAELLELAVRQGRQVAPLRLFTEALPVNLAVLVPSVVWGRTHRIPMEQQETPVLTKRNHW